MQEKELVRCPSGRFDNNTEFTNKLKIEGNYHCPKDMNFQIMGGPSADTFRMVQLMVLNCNQTKLNLMRPGAKCKPLAEITR